MLTSRSNLRQHAKIHKPPAEIVRFQCDTCGRTFGPLSKSAFRIHVLKHEGICKQLLCPLCSRVLTTQTSYRQHMRKHSGLKPFSCEFCDKCFSEKKYLLTHRRVHTGEKPYSCNLCGVRFNQRSTLTAHSRRHVQPKSNDEAGKPRKLQRNCFF